MNSSPRVGTSILRLMSSMKSVGFNALAYPARDRWNEIPISAGDARGGALKGTLDHPLALFVA